MNIAIFTECYHPTINGVVISIDTYKKELTKLQHNIFIFTPQHPDYKDKEENVFRFFSLPYPAKVKDYRFPVPNLFGVLQKIKRYNIDIIHTQTPFFVGAIALLCARISKIPCIFTFHTKYHEYTHYVPIIPNSLLKKASIKWSKTFCNLCNYVIAPSDDIKNMLLEFGVKTKIETIPTGIDLDEFKIDIDKEKLKEKYKIPQDKFILIFAGRLAKEKNIDFIIDAFNLISKKRDDIHLLIVGGGVEEKNLKLKVESLNLKDNVTFTGLLQKKDVLPLYKISDIFVFSSFTETQGLVISEAQAGGLPVVALAASGVSDVVRNGVDGFLCPNDLNIFVEKILYLLENEEVRKKFSENAKINAEKFSSHTQAEKLIEVYKKIKYGSFSK